MITEEATFHELCSYIAIYMNISVWLGHEYSICDYRHVVEGT